MLETMNRSEIDQDYENEYGSDMPEQSEEELATIKKTMDLFYKFKNYRKRYDHRWMDYYRLMRGQQWDYRRPRWKNSEVINLVWSTIQSQIPLQTDVRPRFSFLAQEPSDVEFATILDTIADSDFEKHNWLKTVFEVLYDGWIYGTSFSSMHYDQEADYGIGAAQYKSEDPFCIYPHPDANDINDDESDVLFYAKPVDTDKLKRAFPERAEYIRPDIFDKVKKERTDLKRTRSPQTRSTESMPTDMRLLSFVWETRISEPPDMHGDTYLRLLCAAVPDCVLDRPHQEHCPQD